MIDFDPEEPEVPLLDFRVWPDGTTQLVEDGPPYDFMSDDYMIAAAYDDEDAARRSNGSTL